MNTKTTKFLAVLAVLAMAFVAFAAVVPAQANDAEPAASTVVPVTPENQGVKLGYLADGSAPSETYDAMLYDSYKLSSMTTDSDGIPTYTVTAKGLITHKNGAIMYGNWAGLGFVAPEGATHYIAAQYLTLAEAQAATVSSIGTTGTAVGTPQEVGSTPANPLTYSGFADYKSAQDYYQVFLWSNNETVVAEDSDLMIFHVILDVTPQADALVLSTSGNTVKGVLDNGVKITAAGIETFIDYTGTITVGKSVFQATNFYGTLETTGSGDTASAQIKTITGGTLELASGTFDDQTVISEITGNLIIGKNVTVNFTAATLIVNEGDIQLKAGATVSFVALTLQKGDLSIAANAQLTATGKITMTEGDLLVRGTLVLKSGAIASAGLALTGNGSIYGVIKSDATDNSASSIANITVAAPSTEKVTFKAYDGSSLIYVDVQKADPTATDVTIDLSGATSTVYLHGTISTSQTYGQTQNVVVDGDLEIKDGAVITINGGFLINDDCRMTITNGKVEVAGAGVDVVINGDIYVDVDGTFTVGADAKSVKINGIVENGGKMAIETTDVSVAKDGKFIINDLAKETNLKAISVAAGGLLQIGGKIGVSETASTITNKGSVVFNEAVLENDVTVIMNGDGAVVSIISATTTVKATNEVTSLTITDKGMTKPTGYPTQTYVNKITLTTTAAGDGFSGIGVAQTVTTVTTGTKVISKFTVAGNYAAVKATTGDTAAKTTMVMDSDGTENANFAFTDEFTIGTGATVDVKKLTTVDYDMYVVGSSGNEAALTGSLVVNGVIAGNSYANIDPANFHAATFSVGSATDKITYFSSIENAIEILEDYTEPIGVTIIGDKLVVNENVTIPANVSLKATNNETAFTIGTKTNNDVVMYVTNGSSIASGLSITVYGTLYLENTKDLKTTKVTADVKTTDGTDLCYTNLYTALANAEFGDIIEVTTDKLDIIKSIVVPEGVVLNIPAGVTAEVEVANKVTITVNGVLMTGGITGPFEDKVSATAAVLVVNGVFMTSETDKPAEVNSTYKAAGAYYYISDDVGDFVYISPLADGAETAAKAFYIYGTVTEIEPIELTKQNVYVMPGADLTAVGISLNDASITVVPDETLKAGELTAVVYGADGESSLAVTDFNIGVIADTYYATEKVNELSVDNIGGTVVIMTGTVFTNALMLDTGDESSFTVAAGAIFYIKKGAGVFLDSTSLIIGDIYVAGGLSITSDDVVVTGDITVLADADEGISGILYVTKMSFVSGVITVMSGATFNLAGTITAGVEPTGLGAAATIVGNVTLVDDGSFAIIAYPGTDMEGMTINNKEPVSTEFYINDELFMTVFSALNKVAIADVIQIPEYDIPELDKKALEEIKDIKTWGAKEGSKIGDYDALYAEIALATVPITTSWVNGLALYIDGARVMSDEVKLTVGVYVISASVNAGYACDNITITFNGTALPVTKEGTLLTIGLEDKGSILAVSGDVYIPEPEPVTPEEKSEWTITTILLVILVILIAIMAVIVALRLNRS